MVLFQQIQEKVEESHFFNYHVIFTYLYIENKTKTRDIFGGGPGILRSHMEVLTTLFHCILATIFVNFSKIGVLWAQIFRFLEIHISLY